MKIGLDNVYGQVKVVRADTQEEKMFPSVVTVATGGAAALKYELPKVINPKQLLMPDNPAMSNARGFAKTAMSRKPKS